MHTSRIESDRFLWVGVDVCHCPWLLVVCLCVVLFVVLMCPVGCESPGFDSSFCIFLAWFV